MTAREVLARRLTSMLADALVKLLDDEGLVIVPRKATAKMLAKSGAHPRDAPGVWADMIREAQEDVGS